MSEGMRWSAKEAQMAAQRVIGYLAGICPKDTTLVERIEEAGSLRRGKADVGDLELVAIAKPTVDLLGGETYSAVPIRTRLETAGWEVIKGREGDKYIKFMLPMQGSLRMPVDLFLTTPEQWGIIHIIRTGSSDFSHRLVTSKLAGGWMPFGMQCADGWLWKNGEKLITREEEDVFRLLGVEWVAPKDREI